MGINRLNVHKDGEVVARFLDHQTAFIVAAGESLEKNYQHLAKIRGSFDAFLVAVDRVAWSLASRGIYADAVVSIDAHMDKSLGKDRKPRPYPDAKAQLWTVATANPNFVSRWPGPRLFGIPAFEGNDAGLLEARRIAGNLPRIACGSNCSTAAMSMCYLLGAKRMVFVGHDFCVDQKNYFGDDGQGEIPLEGDSGWKNQAGKDVRVPYSYLLPKLWTEEVIMQYPKTEYVNATEGGILGLAKGARATVPGMQFMSLARAVEKFAPPIPKEK